MASNNKEQTPFFKRVSNLEKEVASLKKIVVEMATKLETIKKVLKR